MGINLNKLVWKFWDIIKINLICSFYPATFYSPADIMNHSLQEETGLAQWLNRTHLLLAPANISCCSHSQFPNLQISPSKNVNSVQFFLSKQAVYNYRSLEVIDMLLNYIIGLIGRLENWLTIICYHYYQSKTKKLWETFVNWEGVARWQRWLEPVCRCGWQGQGQPINLQHLSFCMSEAPFSSDNTR